MSNGNALRVIWVGGEKYMYIYFFVFFFVKKNVRFFFIVFKNEVVTENKSMQIKIVPCKKMFLDFKHFKNENDKLYSAPTMDGVVRWRNTYLYHARRNLSNYLLFFFPWILVMRFSLSLPLSHICFSSRITQFFLMIASIFGWMLSNFLS